MVTRKLFPHIAHIFGFSLKKIRVRFEGFHGLLFSEVFRKIKIEKIEIELGNFQNLFLFGFKAFGFILEIFVVQFEHFQVHFKYFVPFRYFWVLFKDCQVPFIYFWVWCKDFQVHFRDFNGSV